MKGSILEYLDYKKYLNDWINQRSSGGRGERSRIAEILRCNVAYVSRVLNGGAHLSSEQAHAMNSYLQHSSDEADFFLLLVHYSRAGTVDLQNYYLTKIRAEIERKNVLKNRLDYSRVLSKVDQTTYFSAWYYAAIHLLLAIPELQTKENIARYLRLPPKRVGQVLEFLVTSGLAIERKGSFKTGPTSIHLGNDSSMISKHHSNWRLQAIQSLEKERPDELHYSSAVTVAQEDVAEVRKIIISAIEQIRSVVKSSRDERLYCYSMDLFELGGAD